MQTFPRVKQESVIRLKVAALCASLDTMYCNGDDVEEDTAPFHAIVEKKYWGGHGVEEVVTHTPIAPHAFLYLHPTGTLAEFYEMVIAALCQSISSGELTPVELRVDIRTGLIDAENTWVQTGDFADWCVTRSLEVDDFSARYQDDEEEIRIHLDAITYDKRRELEAPYFDADYSFQLEKAKRRALGEQNVYDDEILENLIRQVSSEDTFPNGLDPHEQPLRTTERNSLLSIIAVLCDEQGLNTDRAAKTAAVIKHRADLAGIYLGETTVENHLKKIPDAITRRLRK
jgi:hypothetical protein